MLNLQNTIAFVSLDGYAFIGFLFPCCHIVIFLNETNTECNLKIFDLLRYL